MHLQAIFDGCFLDELTFDGYPLLVEWSVADSGTGADITVSGYPSVSLFGSEAGTGLDSTLERLLEQLDIGTAIEIATLVAEGLKFSSDSGVGIDTSVLEALLTRVDSGLGSDIAALITARVLYDAGIGVDAVREYIRQLTDSGQGTEAALIGIIGKAMRLLSYLRDYSSLTSYTKKYSDLRTYTK